MAKQFPEIFESFSSIMELLRNDKFQDLLVNYERAKKVFLVGYEVQDSITSQVLFDAQGKYGLKPEDYLIAFAEFVKQKEKEIAEDRGCEQHSVVVQCSTGDSAVNPQPK